MTIRTYFASDLYENLEARRSQIREFANERNSWTKVGEIIDGVYQRVLAKSMARTETINNNK